MIIYFILVILLLNGLTNRKVFPFSIRCLVFGKLIVLVYRLRCSGSRPHSNFRFKHMLKFCARFQLESTAKFIFCAPNPFEMYYRTFGEAEARWPPAKRVLISKWGESFVVVLCSKCYQFPVSCSTPFRENWSRTRRNQFSSETSLNSKL